ncbi:isochorismate synthase [Xylanibacter ruminicola]|uniref:isochorismate synthase n=1 Tax=Xylanibacter ruminicola TaxID=839 RepID=UPI0008EDC82D|nr:isochorismate synthase [Xylanibacter ruminicola]SFC63451.1 isochorismate synthase [Xylanibacter ruminicola]
MSAYAIYRLPHEDHATLITQSVGEPMELHSLTELNGKQGFVVAPFEVKADQPVVLIQGKTETIALSNEQLTADDGKNRLPSDMSNYYKVDFANYHSQLEADKFRKIVLARCADEQMPNGVKPIDLFYRACQLYPRLFIALVDTEKSGCWLTATPEILLDEHGADWRTIALAGTMKLEGDQLDGEGETLTWSTKNIQEQRIVATYITECLEQFTDDFREEGPRTVRAANLVHLRSDFTFKLADNNKIGDLLQALHPTPAVCGLPKREAFKFIVKNEHTPRRYYSGFMGPVAQEDTHLYVSLRCMNIDGDVCHLYAGGGLLKDSVEEQEWLETEAKMETMKRLLYVQQ